MAKKYFKKLGIRKQFGTVQVSKRKKGTWASKYKTVKFTDWEQNN